MEPNELIKIYENCLLIRKSEDLVRSEYKHDLMKTPVHLCNGSETVAVMANHVLGHDISFFGTYRNHHWFLSQTKDLDTFFLELLGRENTVSSGRAGSMHLSHPKKGIVLTSAVVASTLPNAAGWALAEKMRGSPRKTIVCFGDGAMEEGVFWETLNFAKLNKLNLIFVCEDNQLAIHIPKNRRQGFDIKKVVESFDIPFYCAPAWEPENLKKSYSQMAEGPHFLYSEYYRLLEHVGINDDSGHEYRQNVSIKKIDPLEVIKTSLLKAGFSNEDLALRDRKLDQEIRAAYTDALKAPFAGVDTILRNVWGDKS